MNVEVKRVYEPVAQSDGLRVLVDRLWPRGLSKESAKIDVWAKDLAPSTELRRWFHSEMGTWDEFKKRYRRELRGREDAALELRDRICKGKATFLYATKTEKHNHAQILKAHLEAL